MLFMIMEEGSEGMNAIFSCLLLISVMKNKCIYLKLLHPLIQ